MGMPSPLPTHVTLQHIPCWTIESQRVARDRFDFYRCDVLESGVLKAQGLTACTSADFQRLQLMHERGLHQRDGTHHARR